MVSCIACGSQTRAAQAYHDQSLVVLICWFYLPGMLAYIHVYILFAVTIFSLQILDVSFLLPVSIFMLITRLYAFKPVLGSCRCSLKNKLNLAPYF